MDLGALSGHIRVIPTGSNSVVVNKFKENKDRKNLIQIQTQVHKVQRHHHINSYRGRISQLENNNIITYNLDALMEIKHITNRDKRYKQLPFGTVKLSENLN